MYIYIKNKEKKTCNTGNGVDVQYWQIQIKFWTKHGKYEPSYDINICEDM